MQHSRTVFRSSLVEPLLDMEEEAFLVAASAVLAPAVSPHTVNAHELVVCMFAEASAVDYPSPERVAELLRALCNAGLVGVDQLVKGLWRCMDLVQYSLRAMNR